MGHKAVSGGTRAIMASSAVEEAMADLPMDEDSESAVLKIQLLRALLITPVSGTIVFVEVRFYFPRRKETARDKAGTLASAKAHAAVALSCVLSQCTCTHAHGVMMARVV